MDTYPIRLAYSHSLHETFFKVMRLSTCTEHVFLVNSRWLYKRKTTLKVESIGHVNLPNLPSELALFARYYFKVEAIVRVLLTMFAYLGSQLALFVRYNA